MKSESPSEEPLARYQEALAAPHRSSWMALNARGYPDASANATGPRRRLSESVLPLLHLSDAQMSTLTPRRSSCASRHTAWVNPRPAPYRLDEATIGGSAAKVPTIASFPTRRANSDDDPSKSSLLLPPKSPARQPSWISSVRLSGTSRGDVGDSDSESLSSLDLVSTEPPPQPPARVVLSFAQASTLSASGGFISGLAGASPALRRIVSAPAHRIDAMNDTPESSKADPLGSVGHISLFDLVADRWNSHSSTPPPPRLLPQVTCSLLRSMSLDMAVPVPRRRGSACGGGGADVDPGGRRGDGHRAAAPAGDDGAWRYRPRSTSLDEPALVPTRQGSFRVGRLRPTLRRDHCRHRLGEPRQASTNGSDRNCRGLDASVGDPETFLPPSCQKKNKTSNTSAQGLTTKPTTTYPSEIFIPVVEGKLSNRKSSEASEDSTSVSPAQSSPNHRSARLLHFTKAASLPCVTSPTKEQSNKKPSKALPESVQRMVQRGRLTNPTENALHHHSLGRIIQVMAKAIRKESHHKHNSCDGFLSPTEFMEPSSIFITSTHEEDEKEEVLCMRDIRQRSSSSSGSHRSLLRSMRLNGRSNATH